MYLKAHINKNPLDKILVDNGSTMNVILLKVLLTSGKTVDDTVLIDLVVTVFT